MELNLSSMVQLITVTSFAAALVRYLIIMPLQIAIDSLQRAIEKMETVLSHLAEEQKNIDKRLVAVEEAAKSAHKRIDGLEG